MRLFTIALLIGLGLNAATCDHVRSQESGPPSPESSTQPAETPVQESQPTADDQTDPTVPGDELRRRINQTNRPDAAELFQSAKRLQEAGLTLQASERVEELRNLKDVPLEILDEAEIWWASIPPADESAQDLFESAKRLHDAGLVLQSRERLDKLQQVSDASLEILDEAEIWWASVAPSVRIDTGASPSAVPVMPAMALPPLPKFSLKGLVLSTPENGTALLDADGVQISVSLLAREQQTRVPIPPSQFLAWLPALKQRAELFSGDTETSPWEDFEMCVECSFELDGVIYNVESFTRNTVTLMAVPHGERLFVRVGGTP